MKKIFKKSCICILLICKQLVKNCRFIVKKKLEKNLQVSKIIYTFAPLKRKQTN